VWIYSARVLLARIARRARELFVVVGSLCLFAVG
jgi:hypothetical protein